MMFTKHQRIINDISEERISKRLKEKYMKRKIDVFKEMCTLMGAIRRELLEEICAQLEPHFEKYGELVVCNDGIHIKYHDSTVMSLSYGQIITVDIAGKINNYHTSAYQPLDINPNDVFEEVSINLTDVRIKPHVDNPTDEINDQYDLDFQSEHMYVFDQDLEPHQFLTIVAQDVLDFYSDRGDVINHSDVENVFAMYGDVIKGDGSQMYYIPKDEEALLNLIRYKISVEMDKFKFDIDYKKGD